MILFLAAVPQVPIFTALTYYVSVKYVNSRIAAAGKKPASASSAWFTALVFLHNVALCIFSAACFAVVAPLWFKNMTTRPLFEGLCDRDNRAWNAGLNNWSWLFYLSKYYEIVDTIIILIKGRQSSQLQSYHHAGAIITMYLCVSSQAAATWIFVVFNSFIHTIMYAYYAATTLKFQPPGKKYLTTMQITQFLVGGTLAVSYALIPGCLKRQNGLETMEILAYASTIGYLIPLTYLFVDFAQRTYNKMRSKKSE
ncbi:fatty acid elongase [Zopfochytrium polystomum]|nr:fatty acid elongase [Zopfochytrium polystomum]